MELADAVRRRRMVRSFSGAPVPAAVLRRVLDAGLRGARRPATPAAGTPSSWPGRQTAPFWDATTTPDWRARSRRWPGLARAPVVVALFVDPDAYRARYAEPDKRGPSGLGRTRRGSRAERWPVPYWFVDGGFAVMVMLLAAADAGLGRVLPRELPGRGRPCAPRSAFPTTVATSAPCSWASPAATTRRRRRWPGDDVEPADVVHRGRW